MMTFTQIAVVTGQNREAVRRETAEALRKCREWCQLHGMKLADLLPDPPPDVQSEELARRVSEFEAQSIADANAVRDARNEERRRSAKIAT
jgi:hypothetical protein